MPHLVGDAGAEDGLGGLLRELQERGHLLGLEEGLDGLAQVLVVCGMKRASTSQTWVAEWHARGAHPAHSSVQHGPAGA